jgi:hypothetical protein
MIGEGLCTCMQGAPFLVDVILSFFLWLLVFNAGGSDFPVDVIFSYFLKLFWADFNSIKLVNIPSCDFVAFWLLRSPLPVY